MDNVWAIAQLENFIELTKSKNGSGNGFITTRSYSISPRNDVLSQWAIIQKILEIVQPNWRNEHNVNQTYEFGQQRDAAIHAKVLLERDEEIQEHLKAVGPTFSSENLHPTVWGAAGPLWSDGYHRAAVQAASTALDIKLQKFTKRTDKSGSDLVNASFSDKSPIVGSPRILVPDQDNDDSTKSLQNGMRALGQACFSIVRNLSTHSLVDLSESEGLEQLAMLSLFARILDKCSIEEMKD